MNRYWEQLLKGRIHITALKFTVFGHNAQADQGHKLTTCPKDIQQTEWALINWEISSVIWLEFNKLKPVLYFINSSLIILYYYTHKHFF